ETLESGRTCRIVLSFIAGKLFSTMYPFLLFLGIYSRVTPLFNVSIVRFQVSYTNPFKSLLVIFQNLTPLNNSSSLEVSSNITRRNLALVRYSHKSESSQSTSTISWKLK